MSQYAPTCSHLQYGNKVRLFRMLQPPELANRLLWCVNAAPQKIKVSQLWRLHDRRRLPHVPCPSATKATRASRGHALHVVVMVFLSVKKPLRMNTWPTKMTRMATVSPTDQ